MSKINSSSSTKAQESMAKGASTVMQEEKKPKPTIKKKQTKKTD